MRKEPRNWGLKEERAKERRKKQQTLEENYAKDEGSKPKGKKKEGKKKKKGSFHDIPVCVFICHSVQDVVLPL